MYILKPSSPHEGYEPSSVELNEEEAVLHISHPSDCILIEESKIVAETLILRCALRPIPINDRKIKVRLTSEGEGLEETALYHEDAVTYGFDYEVENSQWQAISLDYTGIGQGVCENESFVFYGKRLPLGQIEMGFPLYLKPFRVEEESYQERTTTLSLGQVLTSPPGVLNARVLRGYGGYYKEGTSLEEIQQVYYALTSAHNKTRLRLFSSSMLRESHTPPPQGGKDFNQEVVFNPVPREEEYLSLPGALAAGYAHFSILADFGSIPFSSFLCEPVPGHPTLVNIYFRPS